ncbi:hypothetical protein AMAG_04131 [Allomyces macrogynus ATCC 38327]|uniref:Uncharacterized protein n=1 Tax=Allomyces macrogynus (strain ATCC 38327) TaxID=578462 RepID=A0A0L0S7U5_ALLM3|nr:hypothetical protein AMAG_04131 [Allomyces macrogynus ATCC 38327]|eukprot:KNE58567.1 hypothetical protein AMAG_04131 [Allomyces macrogynus ATCC 38327]
MSTMNATDDSPHSDHSDALDQPEPPVNSPVLENPLNYQSDSPAQVDTSLQPSVKDPWDDATKTAFFSAVARSPRWDTLAIARAIQRPVSEVHWYLSTYQHHLQQLQASVPSAVAINNDDWPEADEANAEDMDAEEKSSVAFALLMDHQLAVLNDDRPLTKEESMRLRVFQKSRATTAMSELHNDGKPLVIMNDAWLDLHETLVTYLRTRIRDAILAAELRLRAQHPNTIVVVEEVTEIDVASALHRSAMPRDDADRARAHELAEWWNLEYEPAHPEFRDEMYARAKDRFKEYDLDLDAIRQLRPPVSSSSSEASEDNEEGSDSGSSASETSSEESEDDDDDDEMDME